MKRVGSRRTAVITLIAILVGLGSAYAQGPDVDDLPPIFTGTIHRIPLPPGNRAWVLQIVSRGGLTGGMQADLAILSDGTMRRSGDRATLRPEVVSSLAERIQGMNLSRWTASPRLGLCNDCVATLVVLTVREPDGVVRTYAAYWDPTTRARVSTDLLEIHDLALKGL